ncbi:MAG: 4-hydroxy-3-methylbut-2-enyl diphosphate reductase [Deltaproteobacteria bacterium HGW-Deltaproteobacteria-11]|nr:MAG: 4-hydroxy-3-methylbut-2-enyl diphosphate reductase [Deltaproteobacteria bacterium HGW-Deltaproteobacteria-11]
MVLDMPVPQGKTRFYTFGPLIHNPQTVELLRNRGVIPISRLDEIPDTEQGATLVIRAHGISPDERKKIREKGIRIIDATCPKVAHVQAIIKKHARKDDTILIIGDAKHPEVMGLLGYAYGKGMILNSLDDVARLPDLARVCVVAQTTQNIDQFNEIVAALRERFADPVVFDTICDSTDKRQSEVKRMAAQADAIVVVGGHNSANTMQLARLSELAGTPTFHIETVDDLKKIPVDGYRLVGVSAGASTPNWIIDRVVDYLAAQKGERGGRFRGFFRVWVSTVRTDLYSAFGAGCLSWVSMLLQELPVRPANILTAALYVYAMHTLNRFMSREKALIQGSFREESYLRHKKLYLGTAVAALLLAWTSAFLAGLAPFIMLLVVSLLGVLYHMRVLPEGWRFRSLKDLPGSKTVSTALAWAAVAAVLPRIEISLSLSPALIVAFLFSFSVVFMRSALSDIMDIQSDRLIGRETIPVLIGEERTRLLVQGIAAALFILLVLAYAAGWSSSLSLMLLICVFYVWICLKLCDRRSAISAVVLEGLLETNYVVAAVGALAWMFAIKWMTAA